MKSLLGATLFLLLVSCTLPQTSVRTGSSQANLIVQGAPSNAVLYVDGLPMGSAPQFNGNPKVLAILEGAHQVEVRQGSLVLFHDKVFVSSGETHAITLLPGASQ